MDNRYTDNPADKPAENPADNSAEKYAKSNKREDLWFSATDWNQLLRLSSLYGYDPKRLENKSSVSAEELSLLGKAISDSLSDIPNHNASNGKSLEEMSFFEWFSGPRKEKLIEFVRFCEQTHLI